MASKSTPGRKAKTKKDEQVTDTGKHQNDLLDDDGTSEPSTLTPGRKPKTDKSVQLSKYIEYRNNLLNEDGTLKARTAPVFTVIGEDLNMTPSAVQRAISRRMNEIFEEGQYTVNSQITNKITEEDIDYCYEHATGTNVTVRVQLETQIQNSFRSPKQSHSKEDAFRMDRCGVRDC